jgi:hypothetical protein
MSRGLRNNNPGNIRQSSTTFHGEKTPSSDPAFKQFKTMALGYRAMFVLLHTYQKKYGLRTIRAMIGRYAPPTENHTEDYVDSVSRWSMVGPDTNITATNRDVMVPIVVAMSRVENGTPADMAQVEAGWKLFIETDK